MKPSEVEAVTLEVCGLLDRLGVPYLVGGSVASSLRGVPRLTRDVDLVADIRADHVASFVAALENEYYVDDQMISAAIRRHGSFNVAHLATMLKVDVFVAGKDPFSLEEMKRRQRLPVGEGAELWVATAEDIVLQKLRWYAKGGGVADQQVRDVVGVLQVQGDAIDDAYLDLWAARLGLTDLLRQARELARPRA
jgi:hypothetical protein